MLVTVLYLTFLNNYLSCDVFYGPLCGISVILTKWTLGWWEFRSNLRKTDMTAPVETPAMMASYWIDWTKWFRSRKKSQLRPNGIIHGMAFFFFFFVWYNANRIRNCIVLYYSHDTLLFSNGIFCRNQFTNTINYIPPQQQ